MLAILSACDNGVTFFRTFSFCSVHRDMEDNPHIIQHRGAGPFVAKASAVLSRFCFDILPKVPNAAKYTNARPRPPYRALTLQQVSAW